MTHARNKNGLTRPSFVREPRRLIVIATEGKETEKHYFSLFQSRQLPVKILSAGTNNRSTPRQVLDRLNRYRTDSGSDPDIDYWLSFDTDNRSSDAIDRVAKEALKRNFKLAISNPCFEFWLLCHFKPHPGHFPDCDHIHKPLELALGKPFDKSRLDLDAFRTRIETACSNARQSDPDPQADWPREVGTHVYRLVESIRKPSGRAA